MISSEFKEGLYNKGFIDLREINKVINQLSSKINYNLTFSSSFPTSTNFSNVESANINISDFFSSAISEAKYLTDGQVALIKNYLDSVAGGLQYVSSSFKIAYQRSNNRRSTASALNSGKFRNRAAVQKTTTKVAVVKNENQSPPAKNVAAISFPQVIKKILNPSRVSVPSATEQILASANFVTKVDLESSLQKIYNEILQKFSNTGSVSSTDLAAIYRQIALSQKIDNLSNVVITNPTISGGTITNVTNLTVAATGSTTITNLVVTNTSTSTFAGGIAITGGCLSVNGTCISSGSGSGTPGGSDGYVQFNSGGSSFGGSSNFVWDNTNIRLGIGTSSPYSTLSVAGQIVGAYFTATTTTASTFPYASTTGVSITGGLTLPTTFNGPLQANAGIVSATTSIGILYGGTGATTFGANSIITSNSAGTALIATTSNNFTIGSLIATSSTLNNIFLNNWNGFGTSTPKWLAQFSSSTAPQLALSDAGSNIWTFRVDSGSLTIGTSSPTTFATSTTPQISIANTGFGTTTLRGLNINAQATSTSNVGENISTGCFAMSGTCMGIFPFTTNAGYNSTSTILGLNGLFSTASSTFSSSLYLSSLTQGFSYLGSNGLIQTIATSTLANYILPFTSYGASTSTILGFTNGLFSTASSTFSSNLYLSNLTQGFSYLGSNGLFQTISTSTLANYILPFTSYGASTSTVLGLTGGYFSTGSSTQSGNFFLPALTQGFTYTGSNGLVSIVSTSTLTNFILTFKSYGVSTSSVTGFLGGFFSTASSTQSSNFYLPALTQGFLYNGSSGLTQTIASSSVNLSWFNNDAAFANNPFTAISSQAGYSATTSSLVIGTTTAPVNIASVTIASSTASQLALSGGAGQSIWTFRNAGSNFYLATTTTAGTATTSTNAMTILGSSGFVGFGTTTPTLGPLTMNSGAYVTTGGVWTNASDRNLKENFLEVNIEEILNKIVQLPITQWNYKAEPASTTHIGPVAQDFYAAFHTGGSNTSISTIDPAGVALVGIKALYKMITDISKYFVNDVLKIGQVSTKKLCVSDENGETCITRAELTALLLKLKDSGSNSNTQTPPPNSPPPPQNSNATSTETSADTTAPVITIISDNPANVFFGTTYSDMGATITDTGADGTVNNNLGLHFSVDGVNVDQVIIDTSISSTSVQATTTHTVVYSAVDSSGNWGYATRTVNVLPQ